MSAVIWVHVDDRGLTRQHLDIWGPYLDVDNFWISGSDEPDYDDDILNRSAPILVVDPAKAARMAMGIDNDQLRILLIFTDFAHLRTAADAGLAPQRVVITNHQPGEGAERIAAGVELHAIATDILADLEQRGFEFLIQPIPNVTARAVSIGT